MHSVAIVILNWNGRMFLEKYLPSLLASLADQPYATVIVADNGSTDGSLAFLQEHYPQLRTIIFAENHGYTGGYNKALEQIEADYYLLLNSDILCPSGWLAPLYDWMETHPETGICAPKLRAVVNPAYFEYAGACGGFIDGLGYPFCRGRILSKIEVDHGQYDKPVEIFWASGACLMIRSQLFHQLGGLDNAFFAHMEEIDLCWRAHLSGAQVWVVPQSHVFHLGGGSLPNDSPRKLYLNYRNNLCMLYKNLTTRQLFPVLCARILLDYMAASLYLLQGHPRLTLAVFRGHHHFWWRLRPKLSRQAVLQARPEHKKACQKLIWPHSIVLAFFRRRQKLRFEDLHFSRK